MKARSVTEAMIPRSMRRKVAELEDAKRATVLKLVAKHPELIVNGCTPRERAEILADHCAALRAEAHAEAAKRVHMSPDSRDQILAKLHEHNATLEARRNAALDALAAPARQVIAEHERQRASVDPVRVEAHVRHLAHLVRDGADALASHLRGRGEDPETLAAVERVLSTMRTETSAHIPDGVPQALAEYAAASTDPRVGEAAETIDAIDAARTSHEFEGSYEQL